MDPRLQALVDSQNSAFSAAQAKALGVGDHELRRAVAGGELVRVRREAYVAGAVWAEARAEERFLLTATAVARTRPGDGLSHHAALALHGLPLWDCAMDRIDLVGAVHQVTHRRGLALHPASGLVTQEVRGVPVVSVARAIVRSAVSMGRDCAVVAGDAALHRGLVTVEELLVEVARLTPHEGRGRAHAAVLRMDGRAESVGESRTRLVCEDLGLAHESQVVIRDESGRFVARVDLLVEGVVVEFDGKVKYGRSRDAQDGAVDAAQVLWNEKRREDAIRRQGHPVERVVWEDLSRPALIGARIRQARALVRSPREQAQRPGA